MTRFVAMVAVLLLFVSVDVHALANYPVGSTGYDVSWPNCEISPPPHPTFGIVGVNFGRVFTGNPCLHDEATWFQNLSLYLNTAYPGESFAKKYQYDRPVCATHDENCLAYNVGWNAAHYAVTYAGLQDVHAFAWWLDVETVNSWTANIPANTESLQGMLDALRHYTFLPSIGFYAFPGQWQTITYGWQNDLPAWAATGSLDRADALAACKAPSFNGSKVAMAQYTTGVDRDYVCAK
jgi:hypothetical protein